MRSPSASREGIIVLFAALLLSSCASGRTMPGPDVITVEGIVTVRGNEPFAAYVLETDQRNYYVLEFAESTQPETPASLRVTGRVYRGEWGGRPFAHLEVHEFELSQ